MLKDNKRHNSIFEIKNYKRFNFKIIKNIKKFRRRIHAIYST